MYSPLHPSNLFLSLYQSGQQGFIPNLASFVYWQGKVQPSSILQLCLDNRLSFIHNNVHPSLLASFKSFFSSISVTLESLFDITMRIYFEHLIICLYLVPVFIRVQPARGVNLLVVIGHYPTCPSFNNVDQLIHPC